MWPIVRNRCRQFTVAEDVQSVDGTISNIDVPVLY